MIRLTLNKKISIESEEWLQILENKLNASKLLKQQLQDFMLFGNSIITTEEVLEDIINDNSKT